MIPIYKRVFFNNSGVSGNGHVLTTVTDFEHFLKHGIGRLPKWYLTISDHQPSVDSEGEFCDFKGSLLEYILEFLAKNSLDLNVTINFNCLDFAGAPFTYALLSVITRRYPNFIYTNHIDKYHHDLQYGFTCETDFMEQDLLAASEIRTIRILNDEQLQVLNRVPKLRRLVLPEKLENFHYKYNSHVWERNHTLLAVDFHAESTFSVAAKLGDGVVAVLKRNQRLAQSTITGIIHFLAAKKFNRSTELLFSMDRHLIKKIAQLMHGLRYNKEHLNQLYWKIGPL